MASLLRRAGTVLVLYLGLLLHPAPSPGPTQSGRRFPRAPVDAESGEDARTRRLLRLGASVPGPDSSGEPLGGPSSFEEEKLANRAIPNDAVPWEMSEVAQQAASDLESRHDGDEIMPFGWQSLGPTNAVYPALLNRTHARYVTSGASPLSPSTRSAIPIDAGSTSARRAGASGAPTTRWATARAGGSSPAASPPMRSARSPSIPRT